MDTKNDIRRMISSYFRVVSVDGNILALKFALAEKTKKRSNRSKLTGKDIVTHKFKPNAIFLDKREIYAGKLLDLSDLEKVLKEAQEVYDSRVR